MSQLRSRLVTGASLLLAAFIALKVYQWSIVEAVEYSAFTAFWVGVTQLTAVIWAVDVLVLTRWSITDAIFKEKNRAVAIVVGALILGGAWMFSRV